MGAQVAALHPLMTFPHVELERPSSQLLDKLSGCYWALETGDTDLAEALRQLVVTLRGHLLVLSVGSRIPYHIGAVFASNYVVALVGAASALFETCGISREESLAALLPLLRASVDSLAELGIPQALSGPVARGDTGTVAAHLDWLEHYRRGAQSGPEAADVSCRGLPRAGTHRTSTGNREADRQPGAGSGHTCSAVSWRLMGREAGCARLGSPCPRVISWLAAQIGAAHQVIGQQVFRGITQDYTPLL